MKTNLSSNDVKAAFKSAGLAVRVRDLGVKFRICNVLKSEHASLCASVSAALGMTDTGANAGGQWNGSAEFISYKPGMVVRV